jgi:hypothetical protein
MVKRLTCRYSITAEAESWAVLPHGMQRALGATAGNQGDADQYQDSPRILDYHQHVLFALFKTDS